MNLNYINWYLVELRRRIHQSIPLGEENSFMQETKNHLESLAEEFQQQGMDAKAAEIAAIERFGTPDSIASQCLLGYRRQREKRLVQVVGMLFTSFTTLTILDSLRTVGSYSSASTYVASFLPIVLMFGMMALLLAKIPPRQWFAFPLLLIIVLGAWTGYRNTYYSSPGNSEEVISYSTLHDQYSILKSQHLEASNKEHIVAESLRASLATTVDIAKGKTTRIPSINYIAENVKSKTTNSYVGNTFGVSAISGQPSFRYLPLNKELVLAGPLTAHDVRSVINRNIETIQRKMADRQAVLTAMQSGLSISVKARLQTFIKAPSVAYLFFIAPLSLLVSFFTSRIRNRIRFNSNKLRLA